MSAVDAVPAGFHCPACCPVGSAERRGYEEARALFGRPYPPVVVRRGSHLPALLWLFLAAFAVGYLLTAPSDGGRAAPPGDAAAPAST